MSTVPSPAAATTDVGSSSNVSLKQLRSSLHLDFSAATSSKKQQLINADLLHLIKASPTLEKIFSQGYYYH
ncbi:unnamed protein product [Gongylonema pulchrum]|uniref:SAP30_Sin3_bdg domain-containing protein n=1 Tax=Gongylonema pulchrum TaxID=637853 RepID=A0A183E9W5_9BILA|nr:unnamed protein product [Gongylonema pulchrum]